MRRLALFSDIHANLPALDAVLADIDSADDAAGDAAERYCLGDLIGYGPDPAGVIGRMRALGVPTIPGNYDEGVASRSGSCGCHYATDQAREDGDRSYAFTEPLVSDDDAAWLLALPRQVQLTHGGARILLAHGSPRKVNEYLLLDRTQEQLARLAREAGADVVCHGHIHIPYHRSFAVPDSGFVHYISSGSVGKPKDGDPRACWVEVFLGMAEEVRAAAPDDSAAGPAGETGTHAAIRVHRVAYDVESVAQAMLDRGLPERLADALRNA